MRSVIFCALFVSLFSVVRTAPLPLGIGTVYGHDDFNDKTILNAPGTHDPDHLAALHTATAGAHTQIMKMKEMMDNNHPELHQHLTNAFGANYNQAEIKKVVDKLATGVIDIAETNAPSGKNGDRIAVTNEHSYEKPRISFTNRFHDQTPEGQVGTVIHEASHALGFTKDYFVQHPGNPSQPPSTDPISSSKVRTLPVGSDVKSGYLHQDFEHLKNTASDVMHKNADSYKVFAHTATNGLHVPLPQKWKPGCQPPTAGTAGQAGPSNSNAKKGSSCQIA